MKLSITIACLFILNSLRYYVLHTFPTLSSLVLYLYVTITAITDSDRFRSELIMVLVIISFENLLFVFDVCYNRILIHQTAYEYSQIVD